MGDRPIVQLYCKRLTLDNVEAFISADPDHVGWQLNLTKLDGGLLEAAVEGSREIAARLKACGIVSVLLIHPSDDHRPMVGILDRVRPDIFLASASRSPATLRAVRSAGVATGLMVPVGIRREPEPRSTYDPQAEMAAYADATDWFTTDTITASDTPERFGCSGMTSDWDALARLVTSAPKPVVAAGGLTPANVASLWSICRPAGFDAHTSVCGIDGQPDPDKSRDFVRAVRDLH